jgi:hypothetical protein
MQTGDNQLAALLSYRYRPACPYLLSGGSYVAVQNEKISAEILLRRRIG